MSDVYKMSNQYIFKEIIKVSVWIEKFKKVILYSFTRQIMYIILGL